MASGIPKSTWRSPTHCKAPQDPAHPELGICAAYVPPTSRTPGYCEHHAPQKGTRP